MSLTQESFEQLLAWLHADPEEAGKKYVKIRSDLTKKFISHHRPQPERLSDFTIDRVAKKVPEIRDNYVGDPERYFHRVAYYVLLESMAKDVDELELDESLPLPTPEKDEDIEAEFNCLEKCMGHLSPQKEYLIRHYYVGEKGAKIQQRKELANRFNLELPALRVQALRIRLDLKCCIRDCMRALGR